MLFNPRNWWIVRAIRHLFGLDDIKSKSGTVNLRRPWYEEYLYYLRLYWWVPLVIVGMFGLIWLLPRLLNNLAILVTLPWFLIIQELYVGIPDLIKNLVSVMLGGLLCRTWTWLSSRKDKKRRR